MYTQAALSPELSPGTLLFSLISLTAVYGGLMVVELRLLTTYVKGGVASAMPELASSTTKPTITDDGEDVLSFAY
jgi:cytochrome d ubiquinol oxidase subunit I